MENFLQELEELAVYPEDLECRELWESYASFASVMTKDSLSRQYVYDDQKADVIRLSSVGKTPALDLAAKHFKVLPQGTISTVSAQQRLLFWSGDTFETWVYFQLRRLGYAVTTQLGVEYHGVPGHIDFFCTKNKKSFVLETKTANDYYFKQVNQYGVGDERGYLTQLGGYAEALNVPAYWLFMNKNTSELSVIPCEKEVYAPRIRRLDTIIDGLEKITTFEEAYEIFRPVPPSVELCKGKPVLDDNGKPLLYVPSNVSHPDIHYVYETRKTKYSKPRKYVLGYNPLYTRSDIYDDALLQAGL